MVEKDALLPIISCILLFLSKEMTGDGQPSTILVAVLGQESVKAFSQHLSFVHMGWGLDSHEKDRTHTQFINSVLIPFENKLIDFQLRHRPAVGQTKGL